MLNTLPDFSSARVLVAGDLMLDRYWSGSTARVSPEAPVPVVHVEDCEDRAGGAGNVALNISALGGQCLLAGITGEDDAAGSLQQLFESQAVSCHFNQQSNLQTTVKLRVVSRHQQLIRLDFEDAVQDPDASAMTSQVITLINQSNLLLLSDYGKGSLNQIQPIIQAAKQLGTPVFVDPKGSDFERYRKATLLTPNRAEFEAVVGQCREEAELLEKGQSLLRDLELQALLITRGAEGMTLIRADEAAITLPAHAREVFDVTGAGDTVIATLATAVAAGTDLGEAARLANYAASVAVGKLGTATVSTPELQNAMLSHQPLQTGLVTCSELQAILTKARDAGERIVMTNGCFDLLHAGHVDYLAAARAEGDRLIVAVNSDASVQRLKGASRPVNPLAQRMTVLAALESVDWVLSFDEDTPEALICQLLPDILVKGGDYQKSEIAGGDCVLANGGRIEIKPFVEGQSSSAIIERIRQLTSG